MKLTIILIAIQLHLLINSGFAYNQVCNRIKFKRIDSQYKAQGMIIEEISWKATRKRTYFQFCNNVIQFNPIKFRTTDSYDDFFSEQFDQVHVQRTAIKK